MTRALIRKELRALRPWAVLSLCIGLIDIAEALLHQPDMRPLSLVWTNLGESSGIVEWLVAYAIGAGVVTREQDDGTLVFLDGLPVSRTHVFSVKCALICGVLFLGPTMQLSTLIVEHVLSHGSLDAALRLDILLGLFGLHLAAIVHGVFVGAAMGMLRSLTWVATAAIATSLALLVERVPRSACLNPLSLLTVHVTGAGLAVDSETLFVQLGIAVLAGLFAWLGFVRSGGPSMLAELSKRPVLGAVITALTVAGLMAALTIQNKHSSAAEAKRAGDVSVPKGAHFASAAPAQTATGHYRFAYGATQATQALALAGKADDIFERVHAIIGAPLGESIDVDTSGSARNTEGTAYFGRVRLLLNDDAPIVLAHETSHVVAQRLAGRERDWLWRKARVLDEGLATYVEQAFAPDKARTEKARSSELYTSDRLLLAALYTRHELLVPELVDYRLLATLRDDSLQYPIGAAVISAMVRVYGSASISRLVRAFANDKLPADLDGLTLMETVFHAAGMDFGAVLAELFKQVADDAQLHASELAVLPRPRVRLVRRSDSVGVQVLCDVESGAQIPHTFHLRFKPQTESPLERYDHVIANDDRPEWRAASQVQYGQLCVQAGLRLGRGRVLYEPWACLSTDDAAVWQEPASE